MPADPRPSAALARLFSKEPEPVLPSAAPFPLGRSRSPHHQVPPPAGKAKSRAADPRPSADLRPIPSTFETPLVLFPGLVALWRRDMDEILGLFVECASSLLTRLNRETPPGTPAARRVEKAILIWNQDLDAILGWSLGNQPGVAGQLSSGVSLDRAMKKKAVNLIETGSRLLVSLIHKVESREEFWRIHGIIGDWNTQFQVIREATGLSPRD
jgi:hypothetical protein